MRIAEYERKIAELENKVDQLTMEIDLLKKGARLGRAGNDASCLIVSGPGSNEWCDVGLKETPGRNGASTITS